MEDSKLFLLRKVGKVFWANDLDDKEDHILEIIREYERDYGKVDELLASFFSAKFGRSMEFVRVWSVKRGGRQAPKGYVPPGYWDFPESWKNVFAKAEFEVLAEEEAAEAAKEEEERNFWCTDQAVYNAECEAAYARAMERKRITGELW
jgi:hypothetical protein